MYKHYIYCFNDEYEAETEDKATVYVDEGMVYIQNEDGEEVFAINKSRLEAISLNHEIVKVEAFELETVKEYADGEKRTHQTINISGGLTPKEVARAMKKVGYAIFYEL